LELFIGSVSLVQEALKAWRAFYPGRLQPLRAAHGVLFARDDLRPKITSMTVGSTVVAS
jgi:hypothetical protein